MLAIFVTINIQEEYLEQFIQASLGDAEGSVTAEPNCFRFDINQDEELATRFYLYEVYEDEAAFQHHLTTPHFLRWKIQVESWFVGELEIIRMKTNFPSDAGWRVQKPTLTDY